MDVPKDWWQDFFSGVTVECWLQAVSEQQTQLEVAFIQKMLQVPPPARLLDVPCGGGRHSLALAAAGYLMTGVDISADFLSAARSRAAEQKVPITWEQRDMRDLPWPQEFDGAFCFGNSFGYYDDEGNECFLKAVSRALKPGARFVLDYPTAAEVLLPSFQERSWFRVGNMLFLREGRYQHVQGRIMTEYTFIRDGEVEKRLTLHRIYTYRELCGLLEGAGFVGVEAYGTLSQEPFQLGSRGLFMVARKRAS